MNRNQYSCVPGCTGSRSNTKFIFSRFPNNPEQEASRFVLRKCEECSCIEQTVSYNGSYAPKFIILNSELSDSTVI